MAKRLTDTEKWKDGWFSELSNDNKIIWIYILDNCSHAGLLKKNLPLLNFSCKTSITEAEFKKTFGDRVLHCENHYFIPKFIRFQYGDLTSLKPVVISVIKELQCHNDFDMIKQSLANHSIMIKSKSKSISTDKSKSKSLFKNSKFFDYETFKTAFYANKNYTKFDVEYYYEAIKNWSEANGEKKTSWIATAWTWARKDETAGKPKLIKINIYKSKESTDASTAHL